MIVEHSGGWRGLVVRVAGETTLGKIRDANSNKGRGRAYAPHISTDREYDKSTVSSLQRSW